MSFEQKRIQEDFGETSLERECHLFFSLLGSKLVAGWGGSDALSHFNNGTTLKNQGAVRLAHTASYRHTKHLQLPTKAITYSTI